MCSVSLIVLCRTQLPCRRILERLRNADPVLQETMRNTIISSQSIIQKKWNSHVFSAWFERRCKEMDGNCRIRNLRAAKHRFESYSKPLGRVILWLPTLLATAHDIAVKREGAPEGRLAQAWLQNLNSETLVTLAMLADAGDEGLSLVRQVDDEQTDVASLQRIVSQFLDRARFLWRDGGCLTSLGYTKHCLDLLSEGLLVFTVTGHSPSAAHVLHKPGQLAMDRCLMRMRCWLRLAEETLEAEFPHCHLLRAFSAFDVEDSTGCDEEGWLQTHAAGLRKLAAALKVDGHKLCAELGDHRPIAAAIARETGCGNRRAWQRALEQTQRTRTSREAHPAEALVPTVQRYLAWTCSTSGVEQNFSAAERLRFGHGPASEATEALQLKAALDKRPQEERSHVCARARELFAAVFGPTRGKRSGRRLDKGIRRKQERFNTSETAWLHRRRRSVAEALKEHTTTQQQEEPDQRPAGWAETHEKEMLAQRKKARRRLVEAAGDGYLTPEELTPELAGALATQLSLDMKADAQLATKARLREVAAGIMRRNLSWEPLRGQKAWVGRGQHSQCVQDALVKRGLVVTQDRLQAQVFAVEDVGQAGERVSLLAALRGALLVSFEQAVSGAGVFIQYVPGTNVRREIFVTPQFAREHAEVTRMVHAATTWQNSLRKLTVFAETAPLLVQAGIWGRRSSKMLHDLSKSGGGRR